MPCDSQQLYSAAVGDCYGVEPSHGQPVQPNSEIPSLDNLVGYSLYPQRFPNEADPHQYLHEQIVEAETFISESCSSDDASMYSVYDEPIQNEESCLRYDYDKPIEQTLDGNYYQYDCAIRCQGYNVHEHSTNTASFGSNVFSATLNSFQHRPKEKAKHRNVPEVVRMGATVRERTRMHILNDAFDELRRVIPKSNLSEHQKLSKIATLRQAIQYIAALASTLNSSGTEIRKIGGNTVGDRRGKRRRRKLDQ